MMIKQFLIVDTVGILFIMVLKKLAIIEDNLIMVSIIACFNAGLAMIFAFFLISKKIRERKKGKKLIL